MKNLRCLSLACVSAFAFGPVAQAQNQDPLTALEFPGGYPTKESFRAAV